MGENILMTLRGLLSVARIHGEKERALNLQTMIGDLQRIDKDVVTRDQFVAYLKAQVKALETAKQRAVDVGTKVPTDVDYEQLLYSMLQEYQPSQLTETEIRKYFAELVKLNPGINKGTLMKAIKEEFPGRYDGRMAAQIAGEFN
ncbi:GatB/YqeY domain-containing protein [Salmonella enterica]|nr:GatB/YqeY domain-containing protein [Salmonella enterica]